MQCRAQLSRGIIQAQTVERTAFKRRYFLLSPLNKHEAKTKGRGRLLCFCLDDPEDIALFHNGELFTIDFDLRT
jgi:hypothetical protein